MTLYTLLSAAFMLKNGAVEPQKEKKVTKISHNALSKFMSLCWAFYLGPMLGYSLDNAVDLVSSNKWFGLQRNYMPLTLGLFDLYFLN